MMGDGFTGFGSWPAMNSLPAVYSFNRFGIADAAEWHGFTKEVGWGNNAHGVVSLQLRQGVFPDRIDGF